MRCVGGEVRDQVGESTLRLYQQRAEDFATSSRIPEASGRVRGEDAKGEGGGDLIEHQEAVGGIQEEQEGGE